MTVATHTVQMLAEDPVEKEADYNFSGAAFAGSTSLSGPAVCF